MSEALKLNKDQAIHILGQYADRSHVPKADRVRWWQKNTTSASTLSFILSRLMDQEVEVRE